MTQSTIGSEKERGLHKKGRRGSNFNRPPHKYHKKIFLKKVTGQVTKIPLFKKKNFVIHPLLPLSKCSTHRELF